MQRKNRAIEVVWWLVRGEYMIGLNEWGREVALIKCLEETAMVPDHKGRVKSHG